MQFMTEQRISPPPAPAGIDKIFQLEQAINEQCEVIDFEPLTQHHFADGVYLRELFVPAGVVAVGKIHRTKHMTIIASGTCRITTDDGVKEITGPGVFICEAGMKKAVYAVTDVTIMNAHPTELTDLEKIEKVFIAPSIKALGQDQTALLLEAQKENT